MTPLAPTPLPTVLAWAGMRRDAGVAALFALDAQLGEIVRTTRTPIVGQMRLTWWHDAILALDHAPPPAQPVLRALAAGVLPHGVAGASLADMIDGWEIVLDDDAPDDDALVRYAAARGGVLFAAMSRVVGGEPGAADVAAGRCWALADLAAHVADPTLARRAATAALAEPIKGASRFARALSSDAALAARGRGSPGSPRRAAGVLAAVLRRR